MSGRIPLYFRKNMKALLRYPHTYWGKIIMYRFLTISGPDYNYFIILLLYCIDASVINVLIEVYFDLSSGKNLFM